MKKRLLSVLLCVTMMLTFMPITAFAAQIFVEVTIETDTTEAITLEVESSDTIESVKNKIYDKKEFFPKSRR